MRPAIAWRDGKALQLAHHNVGFPRRLNQAEGYSFGEGCHQQGALTMRQLRNLFDLLDHSEKIRGLNDHRRDFFAQLGFQVRQIQLPVRSASNVSTGIP